MNDTVHLPFKYWPLSSLMQVVVLERAGVLRRGRSGEVVSLAASLRAGVGGQFSSSSASGQSDRPSHSCTSQINRVPPRHVNWMSPRQSSTGTMLAGFVLIFF